ncbi:SRPBCC family protein [Gemmata sp.]|uniref:SRPBCC family protein n=1 Tax=Gemmata sp. TaxID=1914242 RepID=UPI003F6FC50A
MAVELSRGPAAGTRSGPLQSPGTPAQPAAGSPSGVNLGDAERVASALVGGVLALLGLARRSPGGGAAAVAGGGLLYRGLTGHCHLYGALGVNTAEGQSTGPVEVRRSITVDRPADELYRLWRDPQTPARVFGSFADVAPVDPTRARWTVRLPLGRTLTWETSVTEDRPGKVIRWESTEGEPVRNSGEITFGPSLSPLEKGTVVTLRVQFEPPGGAAGAGLVKLLGIVPDQLAGKSLKYFRSLAETGEIPTTDRQPAARPDPR